MLLEISPQVSLLTVENLLQFKEMAVENIRVSYLSTLITRRFTKRFGLPPFSKLAPLPTFTIYCDIELSLLLYLLFVVVATSFNFV